MKTPEKIKMGLEYDPDRYKLEADWEHGAMPGGLSGRMMV